jgi:hypothetical protein
MGFGPQDIAAKALTLIRGSLYNVRQFPLQLLTYDKFGVDTHLLARV